MIDETQNGSKDENTDWIKGPLMTNVTASNRCFSRSNDNCDVKKHVNDDWEDFRNDSDGEV